MIRNPFTPTFGGKPDFFFGRKEILASFDRALVNPGSDERALFVTGNRGCGKTALLEQLSLHARAAGWLTVDVNSENALGVITRHLVRHSQATKTVSPSLGISVMGVGASASGISSAKTTSYNPEDFELIFLEACQQADSGIFVSVDEIQKIAVDELSIICGAFQMASRKGHDVILAVAGLPYSYEQVIQEEGCTFMRRAAHVTLSVFDRKETHEAFKEAFQRVDGVELTADGLEMLVDASYGHPFYIQLAGYELVEQLNEAGTKPPVRIGEKDVANVLPATTELFMERSIAPVCRALPASEYEYLKAMAHVISDDRIVHTADVAKFLDRKPSQLSRTRANLINKGIAVAVGHGELMFNMPYLGDYLMRPDPRNPEPAPARGWRF